MAIMNFVNLPVSNLKALMTFHKPIGWMHTRNSADSDDHQCKFARPVFRLTSL
jgi:predicted lactoylglutathione lyase